MDVRPGYRGLLRLARGLGVDLQDHQRLIARAHHGPQSTLVVCIPRGNFKTFTGALLGLHRLLVGGRVYCGAASRDQAEILFDEARRLAEHPALDGLVTPRTRELRVPGSHLRVMASEGGLAHGLSGDLFLLDELWAHRDGGLLEAFQTALLKRPGAKLIVLSTAAPTLEGPLGRLRARALEQPSVVRRGALTDATGPNLRYLGWGIADRTSLDNLRAVKAANPASTITLAGLAAQREALTDAAFGQLHCGRWGVSEAALLRPGEWQAIEGDPEIPAGVPIIAACDGGGEISATVLCWTPAEHDPALGPRPVRFAIFEGDEGPVLAYRRLLELAEERRVYEAALDPWRMSGLGHLLEEAGVPVTIFPMTDTRFVPASGTMHRAIVEQRLEVPADPELRRHAAAAIARHGRRGWRVDKRHKTDRIDAMSALAMLLDRAEQPRPRTRVLGFL